MEPATAACITYRTRTGLETCELTLPPTTDPAGQLAALIAFQGELQQQGRLDYIRDIAPAAPPLA